MVLVDDLIGKIDDFIYGCLKIMVVEFVFELEKLMVNL